MESPPEGLPSWLDRARKTVPEWIDELRHRDGPGRYRYAIDAYEPYELDSSRRAYATLQRIRDLEWPREEERVAWAEYVKRHQRDDGLFTDPRLERRIRMDKAERSYDVGDPLSHVRKHITRSCTSLLFALDAEPERPVSMDLAIGANEELRTPEGMRAYLEGRDWSSPWGAGSWAGGTIRMHRMESEWFGSTPEDVIEAGVEWLETEQDPETGAWTDGSDVSTHQLINGVFKIWIQLLPVTDLDVQYPDRIVDLCIEGIRTEEALTGVPDPCSLFDAALVLYIALQETDHRREEAADLAADRLGALEPMARPDGAFSYGPEGSDGTSGMFRLGPEKDQSDQYGTTIVVPAATLLASLCGLDDELDWTPLPARWD